MQVFDPGGIWCLGEGALRGCLATSCKRVTRVLACIGERISKFVFRRLEENVTQCSVHLD